jgi:hypothetical protein
MLNANEFKDLAGKIVDEVNTLSERVTGLTKRVEALEGSSPQPQPTPPTTPTPAPPAGSRPFFYAADWLWDKVPENPVLDTASAAVASSLVGGAHVLNTIAYGVTLRGPGGIDQSTPRVDVRFTAGWGPDPFGNHTMPLPGGGVPLAPGGDKHYSVIDPTTGKVYALWAASDGGRVAAWGAMVDMDGDGRETQGGSSTGSNIARHAGVITEQEMADGHIPHALFFSSSKVGGGFRFPAVKTDQSGGEPLIEGMRVQLDPSIDLSRLSLSRPARVIAKCLQEYGAYCGDGGGATVALIAEFTGNSISSRYRNAGVTGDYFGLNDIPWGRTRVLRRWDGK